MGRFKLVGRFVFTAVLLLLVCAPAWAEDPIPGTAAGEGTYFEILDSDYLNITLESTETVDVLMESVPNTVRLRVEPVTAAPSATLTLRGLVPSATYYMLVDDVEPPTAFMSDASGAYTFVQDLSDVHFIVIKMDPEDAEASANPDVTSGTYFEVTGSEYLDVSVETTQVVRMSLVSVPKTVTMTFEPFTGALSTDVTLGGLEPGTTYYMYEDELYNPLQFTADENGQFMYTQDLSILHVVHIQEHPSTVHLRDDATGGDCTAIGVWDAATKTCTLTADVTDSIELESSGLTVEGNGHGLVGSGGGSGIYAYKKSGFTITNLSISDFSYGIQLLNRYGSWDKNRVTLSDNVITNCTFTNLSYGIHMNSSGSRGYRNRIENNTFSNVTTGMYLWDMVLISVQGNTVEGRGRGTGTGMKIGFSSADILYNAFSGFDEGIDFYSPNYSYSGRWDAMYLDYNVIMNNNMGLSIYWNWAPSGQVRYNAIHYNNTGQNSGNSDISRYYNNNFTENDIQAGVYSESDAWWSGNYWDAYDEPGEGCYDGNVDGYCDAPYSVGGSWKTDYYPRTAPNPDAARPASYYPHADAGGDQTVVCTEAGGAIVTLDGTASYDIDGDALTFTWGGPFGTVTGPTPTVVVPPLNHRIVLTVDDGRGMQDTDSMEVAVSFGEGCGYREIVEPPFTGSSRTISSTTNTQPKISADARYVAYDTYTSANYGSYKIYVYDQQTGASQIASLPKPSSGWVSDSLEPAVSSNGRYVAFRSAYSGFVSGDTNYKNDIFVRDRSLNRTYRMSVSSAEVQGNNDSYSPAISADGRYVAFRSRADNLVPGDENGTYDIFVRDRTNGTTERVSVDNSGVEANAQSYAPAISGDGRYVAFYSQADNLVPGDTNGTHDIFVRDRANGATVRVSVDTQGIEADGPSYSPAFSSDGRYVAFSSDATNLVTDDPFGQRDVFIHDLLTGVTELASINSYGVPVYGASDVPSLSSDGRYVAFQSTSSYLIPGDTNGKSDIFVHDRQTGRTVRASVNDDGGQMNVTAAKPSISSDGRHVTFRSTTSSLNGNNVYVVYLGPENVPPTANAGPDTTAECAAYGATPVTLDGSASYDPDLDLLTYVWSPFDPPATGVGPQVLLPYGTATITLTVDDGISGSDSDTVDVTVADTKPPVTTVTSIVGEEGDNGWYTSAVTVTLDAEDGCTGVREVHYRVDTDGVTGPEVVVPGSTATVTLTDDGVHEVYYWSVDNQGNVETMPSPQPVKKDATPPDTTPTAPAPPDDTGGHHTGCVNVTLQTVSGSSGTAVTQYSYDGSTWYDYTGQFQVCNDGTTQVYSRGISNAGVAETPKPPLVILIDTTPPATTISLAGTMGLNDWYVTDVVVTLQATDATSGVAEVHYVLDGVETVVADPVDGTVAFPVSSDGPHTVTYWSKDVAGNTETVQGPESFKIDNTDPSITILGVEPVSYALCNAPTPSYELSDEHSGIDESSVVVEHIGGNANGVGEFTYAVTVSDNAGRTATESVTYKLVYVAEGGFDGFQMPVTLDKPFRQGSTIPVKFVITDGCGTYISNAAVALSIQQLSGSEPAGDPIEGTANQPDAGNAFRYDPLNNHYIYNLSTTDMGVGTWRIIATPDDGEDHAIDIGLK